MTKFYSPPVGALDTAIIKRKEGVEIDIYLGQTSRTRTCNVKMQVSDTGAGLGPNEDNRSIDQIGELAHSYNIVACMRFWWVQSLLICNCGVSN